MRGERRGASELSTVVDAFLRRSRRGGGATGRVCEAVTCGGIERTCKDRRSSGGRVVEGGAAERRRGAGTPCDLRRRRGAAVSEEERGPCDAVGCCGRQGGGAVVRRGGEAICGFQKVSGEGEG